MLTTVFKHFFSFHSNVRIFSVLFCQNERLQALLGDNEKMNLSDVELIPLPLEPQVKIRGIIPETATLFKVILVDLEYVKLYPSFLRPECRHHLRE